MDQLGRQRLDFLKVLIGTKRCLTVPVVATLLYFGLTL
jgi:hypothetical protein